MVSPNDVAWVSHVPRLAPSELSDHHRTGTLAIEGEIGHDIPDSTQVPRARPAVSMSTAHSPAFDPPRVPRFGVKVSVR